MSDIEKIKHCGECPYYNKVGEYCTEFGEEISKNDSAIGCDALENLKNFIKQKD